MRKRKSTLTRGRNESFFEFEALEPRQLFAADLVNSLTNSTFAGNTAAIVQADSNSRDQQQHSNDNIIQRIINGTQTSNYQAVGIVNSQCTGTLIAANAVLTAAHCVEGIGKTQGAFEVGGKTYTTTNMIIHPEYQTSKDVDLAIMILSQNVTGIAPMAINRITPQVGQLLTLVGFGAIGNGNSGHDGSFGLKHEGKTPIDEVTSTHINWTFDNNSESNTAPGDSGGPAFLNQGGKLVIAGVTSGGSRDDAGIGDNSYDVRVDSFASWIDSIVGINTGGGGGGGGGGGNSNGSTFTSNQAVTIPANKTSTVFSSVNVNGLSGKITDVNVKLDINHTWVSDLTVTLISPSGKRIPLFDGVGDDGVNFKSTELDSQATNSIANAQAPFTGTFKPTGNLSALNGENPNGNWRLEVVDGFAQDGGRINLFSVSLKTDNSGSGTGGGDLAALAAKTDTDLQLNYAGSYFQNSGGHDEKWMLGKAGWYFILPDGSLYKGQLSSPIARFDASFYANPKLLHAAGDPQLAASIDNQLGLKFNGSYHLNSGGLNEKWMMGDDGWYFIRPDGSLFKGKTGVLIAKFDSDYYRDPRLLHNAGNRAVEFASVAHGTSQKQVNGLVDSAFSDFDTDIEHCAWS